MKRNKSGRQLDHSEKLAPDSTAFSYMIKIKRGRAGEARQQRA